MAGDVDNIVLEHLRAIRKVVEGTRNDVSDLKLRMSATEGHLAGVQIQLAGLKSRIDRCNERLTRVERRLSLVDA